MRFLYKLIVLLMLLSPFAFGTTRYVAQMTVGEW